MEYKTPCNFQWFPFEVQNVSFSNEQRTEKYVLVNYLLLISLLMQYKENNTIIVQHSTNTLYIFICILLKILSYVMLGLKKFEKSNLFSPLTLFPSILSCIL